MTKNIMIVGVGGQGTLVACNLLGKLLVDEGYDVKMSEVHGMSQRGGSVVTFVRFGDKVYSPVIADGEADYILAFEKIEAARYIQCLKPDGKVIVNDQEVDPMPVIIGAAEYPHDALDQLRAQGVDVDAIDALALAEQAGNSKSVNVVLMGLLSRLMSDISDELWQNALVAEVKPKFLDLNRKAFDLGKSCIA